MINIYSSLANIFNNSNKNNINPLPLLLPKEIYDTDTYKSELRTKLNSFSNKKDALNRLATDIVDKAIEDSDILHRWVTTIGGSYEVFIFYIDELLLHLYHGDITPTILATIYRRTLFMARTVPKIIHTSSRR